MFHRKLDNPFTQEGDASPEAVRSWSTTVSAMRKLRFPTRPLSVRARQEPAALLSRSLTSDEGSSEGTEECRSSGSEADRSETEGSDRDSDNISYRSDAGEEALESEPQAALLIQLQALAHQFTPFAKQPSRFRETNRQTAGSCLSRFCTSKNLEDLISAAEHGSVQALRMLGITASQTPSLSTAAADLLMRAHDCGDQVATSKLFGLFSANQLSLEDALKLANDAFQKKDAGSQDLQDAATAILLHNKGLQAELGSSCSSVSALYPDLFSALVKAEAQQQAVLSY